MACMPDCIYNKTYFPWSGLPQEKDFSMQAVENNNLKKTEVDDIISFLKTVGLYGKIKTSRI